MSKLTRMLVRDLWKSKGQFIAAAAVVFAGIVMFGACYMAYRNLKNSLEYYYKEYSFLDYYADVQSVTPEILKRIKSLEGVKQAIGRVSMDVGADMGDDRRVTVRLVSLPDNAQPEVNRIFLASGSYFSPTMPNSCLVSQKFAAANRLGIGDTLKVIINRRIYELRIDGLAGSPEYIYAMKSASTLSFSDADFGVVYIKQSAAFTLFDRENTFNQVHVVFTKGTDEKRGTDEIEKLLKPGGFIGGTKREDQLSHTMIHDEIKQLEMMALMFPTLFLSVAAIIIYIMLRRIVNNQRSHIGVMKAFGYTNGRILAHYTGYALLISVAGSIPGAVAGIYAGTGMTSMYTEVYNIPVMDVKIFWDVLLLGIVLSAVFCFLAGYNSAKKVLAIQPAEAMRSEAPKIAGGIFIERFGFLWKRLSFGWKVSVRNIFRSRQRTLLTIAGTAFTIMFFMITLFFLDAMDYFLKQHYTVFQRQDLKVAFSKPAAFQDAWELGHIAGVKRVEPIMEVPVVIKKDWMDRGTLLVGMVSGNTFYKFTGLQRQPVPVPENGMIISDVVANKLSLHTGDVVDVDLQLGEKKKRQIVVAGIIKQYIGFNCYMDMEALGKLQEEGKFATGALLSIEKGMEDRVKKELFKIAGVEAVEERLGAYKVFQKFMGLMYTFIGLMVVFGSIMGFAIIFNTTVINIMERRRELASLKVLGYTAGEIERTIFRENMFLGVLALLPGILLGRFMCEVLAQKFSTELFALEVVIYPRTYVIAVVSMFAFILLAQWANRKNITGLDMVEVLKNREG